MQAIDLHTPHMLLSVQIHRLHSLDAEIDLEA